MTWDLGIVGGGSAALSAAIYAARAGLKVAVFAGDRIGGALTEISRIANYPGFVGSGEELAQKMREQAEESGASVMYGVCTEIKRGDSEFCLTIDDDEVAARAVLVATGSVPKPLGFVLETPVSYCALCDGAIVRDKRVAVVGGANAAIQESLYLADIARNVTVFSRSPLRAERVLVEKLRERSNVEIREGVQAEKEELEKFDYVFVFIGKMPATEFLKGMGGGVLDGRGGRQRRRGAGRSGVDEGLLDEQPSEDDDGCLEMKDGLLDEQGYVKVCKEGLHMTEASGLFVAGDVRAGAVRQAVTAAADGAAAAIEIVEFLK